ncbi:glycosyltransferase [Bacteroidota bacterium]
MKQILLLDFCNFHDYPIGGFLSFARNLMSSFGDQLALVGITTDQGDPVGRWFRKRIEGVEYKYFALARYNKIKTKHIIPDRLACYILVRIYRNKILEINIHNVLIQRHEILIAVKNFNFQNICYRFPGLGSPMDISKYWYGKYLSKLFDRFFFARYKSVKLFLAAGDEKAIENEIKRSKGALKRNDIIKFPTRVNTDIFKPINKLDARNKLDISHDVVVIVTTGRLAWFKGWEFLIDSYQLYIKNTPNSLFYFIGDGEDSMKIQAYVSSLKIDDKVILVGRKDPDEVSLFLNASDLFVMGSYQEGWSTSLMEAVACGIPSCVINFSSASEIIDNGINGYVIDHHDSVEFVNGMYNAMQIKRPVYNEKVLAHSIYNLKNDLLINWNLL